MSSLVACSSALISLPVFSPSLWMSTIRPSQSMFARSWRVDTAFRMLSSSRSTSELDGAFAKREYLGSFGNNRTLRTRIRMKSYLGLLQMKRLLITLVLGEQVCYEFGHSLEQNIIQIID